MKRSLLILSALCLPPQLFSQGYIAFNNYGDGGSPIAPVYGPELNNPPAQKWGNVPNAYPPGTQSYTGAPLAGTSYSVEAWYSLTPVSDVFALDSAALEVPGSLTTFYFGGGFFETWPFLRNVTYSGGSPGVYLQVRAWDNAGGQYGSWNEAWNAALAGSGRAVGWSKDFWQIVFPGLGQPASLDNFESFNIFVVPEPSMVSLLGLSSLFLLLVRLRTTGWGFNRQPARVADHSTRGEF
jgi:hypothetical protein